MMIQNAYIYCMCKALYIIVKACYLSYKLLMRSILVKIIFKIVYKLFLF